MRETDVVVVGAGLAGSTAAAMLARAGTDFVVVDPDEVYRWDFRCEKLDHSQVELLRKTRLADKILPLATPINHLWIVRLGRFVKKRRNDQFGIYYDALVNGLRAEIPAERFIVGKVAAITASADRQEVVLSDKRRLIARLVVLATGPNNALRESLGIERRVVSPCHSLSIGFDMKPAGRAAFDFEALTYFPERASSPISYLTLFPIGSVMRANLFVYREARDPWLDEFHQAPQATIFAAMPGLRPLLGDFEVVSAIKLRPVDLYETTGYRRSGVVLVGDAFSSSCPAAGTGANKVFVDVERLCNAYIPHWLATPGMCEDKISAFYDDPTKRACDAHSFGKAHFLRSLSTGRTVRWRLRRVIKQVGSYGRGVLQNMRAAFSSD